jgi:hypothetical protein
VFDETLRSLEVQDIGEPKFRRLRVSGWRGRPLRFDFGKQVDARVFAADLLALVAASPRPDSAQDVETATEAASGLAPEATAETKADTRGEG